MADNTALNAGSGGDTIATDDVAGIKYQRVKVCHGGDGVATDVSTGAAALPIQDGGNTITVDGTVAVSGTVTVDGSGSTQPISAASLPLPSGASTEAKQPALGTAGTASADVITVQGIASMTALKVDGSAVTQPVSGTFWQATQPVSLASVPSHAVTNAGTFAVQVDGSALTALQLIDDGVATVASAITTKGMAAAGTDGTNARILKTDTNGELQVDVLTMPTVTVNAHAVTNAGTFAVQVDGSALTALQLIDNPIIVDDAAFTPATSSVSMAGFQADEASTDSVDEGDAGAARMTLDRKLIVTPQPHTAGGLSIFRSLDLDETEEDVKTSAGCVYAVWVTNTATATRWVKFYNATAANVTVGTTTPVLTIGIPGNTSDDIAGNFGPGGMGVTFDTAISVAATTGVADNDTGAPGANDVIINVFYK